MKLGFDDVMTFGKQRGKTIREVFEREPSYLFWLRDTKKAEGRDFFTLDVYLALNEYLKGDDKNAKYLARKYSLFTPASAKAKLTNSDDPYANVARKYFENEAAAAVNAESERIANYSKTWGSW